jgi:hypothetical protein
MLRVWGRGFLQRDSLGLRERNSQQDRGRGGKEDGEVVRMVGGKSVQGLLLWGGSKVGN